MSYKLKVHCRHAPAAKVAFFPKTMYAAEDQMFALGAGYVAVLEKQFGIHVERWNWNEEAGEFEKEGVK